MRMSITCRAQMGDFKFYSFFFDAFSSIEDLETEIESVREANKRDLLRSILNLIIYYASLPRSFPSRNGFWLFSAQYYIPTTPVVSDLIHTQRKFELYLVPVADRAT